MEAALLNLILDVASALILESLQHLNKCIKQLLLAGTASSKANLTVAHIGDIKRGGIAVCRVIAGIDISRALQLTDILLRA